MAEIHNEKSYGIKLRESADDGSDFSNPEADYRLAFIGEDGQWHLKDSAGTVTNPSGSGIPATLFDAKGDLIAASAADTAASLAAEANGAALVTASGESTGLKWRLNNDGAADAPAVTDDSGDGYAIGSRWIDTTADKEYVATDVTVGAAVWKETTAVGSGGGGYPSGIYHPDVAPSSGLTLNDEFNDSALDGAWTWDTAPAGTVSESAYPGFLYLADGTSNTGAGRLLRRAFVPGATALAVVTKVSFGGSADNFTRICGIMLLTSADAIVYQNVLADNSSSTGIRGMRVMTTDATINHGADDLFMQPMYLAITRDASTNYVAWASADGLTWKRLSGSSQAGTVAKVAIYWAADTDSILHEVLIDFVRVFDSATLKIGAVAA